MTQKQGVKHLPPGLWAIIVLALGLFFGLVFYKSPEPKPYEVPKETIDELRACAKLITVIPIDSCEYIVTPVIGATRGLTLTHKANCKNH